MSAGYTYIITCIPGSFFCVVGKVFCKIINDRLVQYRVLHEGQAGFRAKRSCVYVLSELVQGRLREGKKTF